MWAQNPLVLFRQVLYKISYLLEIHVITFVENEQSQIAAAGQQGGGERGGSSKAAWPKRARQSVFMSD